MKTTLALLAYLYLIVLSEAQRLQPGPCPNVKPQKDFDKLRFLGNWYETAQFYDLWEANCRCTSVDIHPAQSNGDVEVSRTCIDQTTGESRSAYTIQVNLDPNDDAIARLTLPATSFMSQLAITGTVLYTDYENLGMIYGCKNMTSTEHIDFGWILSRTRQPTDFPRATIDALLEQNGIIEYGYHVVPQANCDAN